MVILFSPDGKLALRSGARDKQHKFKNRSSSFFFSLIPYAQYEGHINATEQSLQC